jgi:hypothetical protein
MSERVLRAHQKVPAIPEMAMAASKAVKRDAPNALIAAHPPTKLTHVTVYEQPYQYNSQIAPSSVPFT